MHKKPKKVPTFLLLCTSGGRATPVSSRGLMRPNLFYQTPVRTGGKYSPHGGNCRFVGLRVCAPFGARICKFEYQNAIFVEERVQKSASIVTKRLEKSSFDEIWPCLCVHRGEM